MEVDQESPNSVFSLDLLALTNEARNTYGLRHQDYQRYRQYCAQKLRRLHKALNFTNSKGKAFQRKDITEDVLTDVRFLQIILFNTERAWSYAMELKRESRSNGVDTRKKFHLIKRLKKAVKYAQALEILCSTEKGKVDARTVLEAQAYSALMSGFMLFEQQSWQEALDTFAAARTIYEKLSTAGTSHQEALCQAAIDDIDPNIRYCAYKLRLGTDGFQDVDELVKITLGKNKRIGLDLLEAQVEAVLSQTRKEKAAALTSITWRNRVIPLKNPEMAVYILRAQEAAADLDKIENATVDEFFKIDLFDKVLAAYGDAERVAKIAVKEDAAATAKVKSSKSEKNTENINFVYSYLAYHYLSRRIQRNLMLVDSLRSQIEKSESKSVGGKYQEIVKLYDNVLQSLNEISELPATQDNLTLAQETEAKIWYFKASRTFYVGIAYSAHNKPAESMALYQRAREYISKALSLLYKNSSDVEDILIITVNDVNRLDLLIRGYDCRAQAQWHLEQTDDRDIDPETGGLTKKMGELSVNEKTKTREPPLIKRLHEYPTSLSMSDPNLIDFPPKFVPIPAKPLFFDIASNYIEYPPTLAERAGRKKQATQSRFGIFGKMFGWLAHMGRTVQLVMGPAGSGKSTYCATIMTHCQNVGRTVNLFNLDPAAERFEYEPAIDIRDLITLEDVMEELQFGPNGGLIYCLEFLLNNLDWLEGELGEYDDDYLIIDCPGL
ncbi:hypothetical protein G9A89_012021 [Geosiphon pyriformis]|nr:hypothetical protein G9A89_012021 [Geosiphon pyriformis]